MPFSDDCLIFAAVHPRLGYLHWHVRKSTSGRLLSAQGEAAHGAVLVVRIYDVTDIIFDGFNAHSFFDVEIGDLSGNYYLPIRQVERNLMAEIGYRLRNNAFHALARSNTTYFDRDRPSGKFHLGGLYVGRDFQRLFPVEDVMDAPVYERLNAEFARFERAQPLSLALVYTGLDFAAEFSGRLPRFIARESEHLGRFHIDAESFGRLDRCGPTDGTCSLVTEVQRACEAISKKLRARHKQRPFDLVHCHDWHSIPVGVEAARSLGLPLVLSLHSTEYERARGHDAQTVSEQISAWERDGTARARLVIVPHSSTRHQLISLYGVSSDKVVIIPDVLEEPQARLPDPTEHKRTIGFNPDWPLALFAGEISHAAGADILVDALLTVCRDHHQVQFVLAGEGPLKAELERRIGHAELGNRCRFIGDVSAEAFEGVLAACDFVVIPARTWQDEGLAQFATSFGKPVLTTVQSHIHCIEHGQNGLVTYDNPGSMVWGIKELLANPLRGTMLRMFARRRATHARSLESVAAEHYIAYERALADTAEG